MIAPIGRRHLALGLLAAISVDAGAALAEERPVIPTDFADLLTMARAHVAALSQGHASWGFSRVIHWSVDLDRGLIEWDLPDGVVARAPVQLIGTWASDLGTFRWGWDHPAAPPGTAVAAQQVRDFAEASGLSQLQLVEPRCTRDEARDLASIAVLVGDLQGLYVGQVSSTAVAYLGFGEVTLSR